MSSQQKVYLFVDIDVKPGHRESFVEKLVAHAEIIRTEPGCESLELFANSDDETSVCVWEVWSSRAHWDAHMGNDASRDWQAVSAELVNGETITVLNSL